MLDNYLKDIGFKKHKSTTYLKYRDDMLFVVSRQLHSGDCHLWLSVYPMALPGLWVSMGWSPVAGRAPAATGMIAEKNNEQLEIALLNEMQITVEPFFRSIASPANLAALYAKGNDRALRPTVCLSLIKHGIRSDQGARRITEFYGERAMGRGGKAVFASVGQSLGPR